MTRRNGTSVTTRYFGAADRCFERVFDTDDECDAFGKLLRQNSIDGICDLMGLRNICCVGYTYYTGYKDVIATR